ncbi:MAG: hypothetical protein KF858_03050 [Candidatus Sumerlaeia bacterium]|nr:hypothetical protein [Candidatus Sumerlaeia bacterium]
MAKRATSKKGRKAAKAAKAPRKARVAADIASKLAQFEQDRRAKIAAIEAERLELLQGEIAAKREAVTAAKSEAQEAQRKVRAAEKELDKLLVSLGLSKGRKGKSTRKPRVTLDIKKKAVADTLGSFKSGSLFSDLRTKLLSLVEPKSGGPLFAKTDFNSAQNFGKRFLPRGWKVKGERMKATVEKS